MSSKLSVEEVLTNLEERAAYHRDQEAFHAQQEVHHREQRAVHAAELQKVLENLEAFRTVAASAVDLAQPVPKPAPPPPVEPKLPSPGKKFVSGLLWLVVSSPELSEPFGPKAVAREINRRFRAHLDEPVGPRTASDVLRRLAAAGKLQLVREGMPFHEALYTRRPRKSGQ
jgi:hypothetical protein